MLDDRRNWKNAEEYNKEVQHLVLVFSLINTNKGPKLMYKHSSKQNERFKELNIRRVLDVSNDFVNAVPVNRLAQMYTGNDANSKSIHSDLREKLPVLIEICKQSLEVWDITRKTLNMEHIDELKRLADIVQSMLEKRGIEGYRDKVRSVAKKVIEGSTSQKVVAKNERMGRSYFNENIQRCLEPEMYAQFKEKVFKSRTANISRIIQVAIYIKKGEKMQNIAIKPEVNVSIPVLYRDVDRRFTELLNVYKSNEYIRKTLADCSIYSYEELENLYYEVHRTLDSRQLSDKLERKDIMAVSIADLIINEYSRFGRTISAQEVAEYFRMKNKISITADFVTSYMKGRLFRIDKDKYNQVMKIWAEDPKISKINSFDNDIPVYQK